MFWIYNRVLLKFYFKLFMNFFVQKNRFKVKIKCNCFDQSMTSWNEFLFSIQYFEKHI